MAKDDGVSIPSGFGGLLRFKEEYESYLKFSPIKIVIFLILVVAFVIVLNIFFPIKLT